MGLITCPMCFVHFDSQVSVHNLGQVVIYVSNSILKFHEFSFLFSRSFVPLLYPVVSISAAMIDEATHALLHVW